MTKEQMFIALGEGKKLTHQYFGSDEYIYREGNDLMCESGYLDECEFWSLRNDKAFDDGWSLWNN